MHRPASTSTGPTTHPHLADTIARTAAAAIQQHIFPGAVVLAAHHGTVVHHAAYGTTMYDDPGSQPVTTSTIYDCASLTKMFTATAALSLIDQGELRLDALAASYLPGLHATGVTVRHLLTHTSGLSLRLSSLRDLPPDALRAAIAALEPQEPPGTRVTYVNINSLLLGDIVAQVAGKPLDEVLREVVLQPLGMHTTCFNPPDAMRSRIAPTEHDPDWRGGLVHGSVHDESTHALGGVAGHAGLFSTAADMAAFVQMWLDGGKTPTGHTLLHPETLAAATRVQTDGLLLQTFGLQFHCGLGWMKRHPVLMKNAPDDAYGHTGFTGPTLLAVPSRGVCLVVLSNRTYPRRTPMVHHETTAAVLEAVLAAC